jgi:hypothetical protein
LRRWSRSRSGRGTTSSYDAPPPTARIRTQWCGSVLAGARACTRLVGDGSNRDPSLVRCLCPWPDGLWTPAECPLRCDLRCPWDRRLLSALLSLGWIFAPMGQRQAGGASPQGVEPRTRCLEICLIDTPYRS